MAVEDFCGRQVPEDRGGVRRSPEQARRRLQIVRQWYDVEKVDMVVDVPTSSVALAVNNITREKNKVFLVSGRALPTYGQGMHAQHGALDLRHVGPGQRHRQGDREDRRRLLVLPDGRLRVRSRAGADTAAVVEKKGGKVVGKVRHPLPGAGLLIVPAAGAAVQGQDHRPCQRRRRHDQRHQAGGRVRHRAGRPEPRRPARVHHRRARARSEDSAGPDHDRGLVLGPERQQPRVRQGVCGSQQGQHADHGAGGRLLGRDALPEGRA